MSDGVVRGLAKGADGKERVMRKGDIVVNPWVSTYFNGELNPNYATIYLGDNKTLDYEGKVCEWADKIYKDNPQKNTPWKVIGHIDLYGIAELAIRDAVFAEEIADTPQTDKDKVVCPNCGRSDYIRSFEKDFGIKNSEYRYKCINCNTYIKDTPQTDFWSSVTREDWLKAHGLDADTPQPDCNGCEHWKYIAKEWQCETVKCQKTSQPDCPWR